MIVVVVLVFGLALGVIYAVMSWGLRQNADDTTQSSHTDRKDP